MSGFWRVWFTVFCLSLILFGVVLSGGAHETTSAPAEFILNALGGEPIDFTPELRFGLAVLGAVSIGWAVTLYFTIKAAIALKDEGRPFWNAITTGVACWFVIDSGLSIMTGFGWNVLPNCLLAGMYLIGLFGSGVLKPAEWEANVA